MKEELLTRYEKSGFSEEQLSEIRKGLEEGFDVSVYARRGIPAEDMAYIRKYLFYKKGVREESGRKEEIPEDLNKSFEGYEKARTALLLERIITFSIFLSGLAIISGIFEILILLSRIS